MYVCVIAQVLHPVSQDEGYQGKAPTRAQRGRSPIKQVASAIRRSDWATVTRFLSAFPQADKLTLRLLPALVQKIGPGVACALAQSQSALVCAVFLNAARECDEHAVTLLAPACAAQGTAGQDAFVLAVDDLVQRFVYSSDVSAEGLAGVVVVLEPYLDKRALYAYCQRQVSAGSSGALVLQTVCDFLRGGF